MTTTITLIRFRCFLFDSMLSILYCIPILGLVSLLNCVRLGSTRERPAVSASDLRGSDRQVVSVSREREWAIRKDSPVSARDSPVCPASDWAIRKDSPVSRKGECGSQGGRDRKVQNENQHTLRILIVEHIFQICSKSWSLNISFPEVFLEVLKVLERSSWEVEGTNSHRLSSKTLRTVQRYDQKKQKVHDYSSHD